MITSWFMPFMNCSFSILSFSLKLHSAAFIHNLPIQSCADSSLFLFNLQYHNDNMVLLCCGLNSHLVLLLFCMLLFHNLWMFVLAAVPPFLASFFLMIGTFSSLFSSCAVVCSMFITSISKFNISTYFSVALQSNDGCLCTGLQCLGMCASPMCLPR